jgi:hypothetical protein|tara:strand:- start:7 stop:426 length:420 start_codon:yes stop_codon:yes gene_type:complete
MMAAQKETAIISGKAFWTKLNRKDEYSDKYQLDVGDLSEKSKEVLTSHGVKLKNKNDDRGEFITARTQYIVPVMDSDKKVIDKDTLIGNGSSVRVKVDFNKTHPFVEKYGTSMYLKKVQVTELVEYGSKDGFDDDDDML